MEILLTTYPNKPRELKRFIVGMIKGDLAKCVNRINYVKSYYMWEWKLVQDEEKILLIKFPANKKQKLLVYFEKNHPYEVPEIIFLEPKEVWEKYLKWIWS